MKDTSAINQIRDEELNRDEWNRTMLKGYLKGNGKHPAEAKENRQYYDDVDSVACFESYCYAYSEDWLKVDIDDFNHKTGAPDEPIQGRPRSTAIIKILEDLNIRYNGIRTEHGVHLFFRKPDALDVQNRINWYSPMCVKMEWKFPERDDHIPLKVNGVERTFFKGSVTNDDIDELPAYLFPLQKYQHKPFLLEFPEGDRTQHLGAYLFYLTEKKGFSAEQAFQVIRLLNEYIFDNPIPEDTLNAEILNDSTLKKLEKKAQETSAKSIPHSELAKEIIDHFRILTVNGSLYTYDGGVYRPLPEGRITQYLTKNYPNLNANNEREIMRDIKGLTYTEYPPDDGTVNVKNGILKFSPDGSGVELLEHGPSYVSFRQFHAAYDPGAESKLLDEALDLWFGGSRADIDLFGQVLGYLLMNHVKYEMIFFFIGAPSTGKTTLLKLITEFCGKENVSVIQLEDLNKPFGLASIVNKTANIFSDVKKTKVIGTDVFRMLADGSELNINQKYRQEFKYSFTGKLLFGMNNYPDFSHDFDGIKRRLTIFEFRHVFKKGDSVFNPSILDELTSPECMSALLNKAIAGYGKLIRNNGFDQTERTRHALNEFVAANDTVTRWMLESGIDEDYLLRQPIKGECFTGSYPDYKNYCIEIGEEAKAQKDFTREICNQYGLETYRKRVGDNRFRMFRKK